MYINTKATSIKYYFPFVKNDVFGSPRTISPKRNGEFGLPRTISPKRNGAGFTLIELLVVVAIISLFSSVVFGKLNAAKTNAAEAVWHLEVRNFATAVQLYLEENDFVYPADVSRDVPSEILEYLAPGDWPKAPWPQSVYDWDNWDIGGEQIVQISVRFCPFGDYDGDSCKFPDVDWAEIEDFDYWSSAYYCFTGPCRSHSDKPIDHPGHCLNCGN